MSAAEAAGSLTPACTPTLAQNQLGQPGSPAKLREWTSEYGAEKVGGLWFEKVPVSPPSPCESPRDALCTDPIPARQETCRCVVHPSCLGIILFVTPPVQSPGPGRSPACSVHLSMLLSGREFPGSVGTKFTGANLQARTVYVPRLQPQTPKWQIQFTLQLQKGHSSRSIVPPLPLLPFSHVPSSCPQTATVA